MGWVMKINYRRKVKVKHKPKTEKLRYPANINRSLRRQNRQLEKEILRETEITGNEDMQDTQDTTI
jgi:hypothetical protein